VSGAGDVDGNGIDDVLLGAERSEAGGDRDDYSTGEAYVVFARPPLDVDRDDTLNDADNWLVNANADQRDTDADEIGNRCDADLNNVCVVNFVDLDGLKQAFFGNDADADFNGDGAVNVLDLGIMKGFFQPPGPSGVPNLRRRSTPRGRNALRRRAARALRRRAASPRAPESLRSPARRSVSRSAP
jgi:hypothetical protein